MMNEQLERVLQLAEAERRARDNPLWKTAMEDALEAHSEAVDNLYAELYRLLDERQASGDPVLKPKLPPDPRKELKNEIIARLKEELPSMVASIIDEF
jgi:hypothetical protein